MKSSCDRDFNYVLTFLRSLDTLGVCVFLFLLLATVYALDYKNRICGGFEIHPHKCLCVCFELIIRVAKRCFIMYLVY